MLRAVPSGRSFFGWGTTTVILPFLNLWCDPFTLTSSKPSALRRLTISRLLRGMRNYIHTKGAQRNVPARFRRVEAVLGLGGETGCGYANPRNRARARLTSIRSASSRRPRRDPSLARFTVMALSTMIWERSRRPFLG